MTRTYRMSQIMTAKPITIGPDERPYRAQQLMEKNNIRHLPVIAGDGEVVGILTDRALSKMSSYRYPEYLRVVDFMEVQPFCVPSDSYAAEALQLMTDFKMGAIMVTTGRRTLEGIFTRHDALNFLNNMTESRAPLRLVA